MHRWTWTVIECCWAAWLVLWLVLAFFTKRTISRPGGAWGLASGFAAGALFLVLRVVSGRSWPDRLALTAPALQAIAVALVIAGLGFCAWARLTLGTNWSGTVVLKDDHELIQSGPYALVRHPIYSGMLTMVAGTALDYPAVFSFSALGAIFVVFYVRSGREERLMAEHFPDQYPAYRARTKALIPFVL